MTRDWETLLPLLIHIQAHLEDDLGLAALGRKAGLSPFHLQRLFKSAIGETPKANLGVQIALLRKAQLAFSRGGAEQALILVAEHRKKYPETPLEAERSALEALAACRQRRPDAVVLARAFLDRWPKSPQADRVARSCAP